MLTAKCQLLETENIKFKDKLDELHKSITDLQVKNRVSEINLFERPLLAFLTNN